ncbi:hypothetical protein Pcinc_009547 [Petrolisthes cinctipes]|uniref:Uncharacterized protein n=1 Tax=Petrolisthes cinctipes TaxID=88211 RepID=A0AAE1G565_PETCI|nr:hypothetical protein Pcinc_009547 [Petrolisthes cinctipes]
MASSGVGAISVVVTTTNNNINPTVANTNPTIANTNTNPTAANTNNNPTAAQNTHTNPTAATTNTATTINTNPTAATTTTTAAVNTNPSNPTAAFTSASNPTAANNTHTNPTAINTAANTTSSASRRVSHIKLIGIGNTEGQNYCCNHWFTSSKSFHRHLAEKALSDTVHEMKLVELGMLRCTHCSMWVHVDGGVGVVVGNLLNTNPASKPTVQNASKPGTVKLVATTTPTGTLYHRVKSLQQQHHQQQQQQQQLNRNTKVIVHKSVPNTKQPYVNVGPRIVMKTIGPRKILTLDSNCTILPQSSSQTITTASGVSRGVSAAIQQQRTGNTASQNSINGGGGAGVGGFGITALSTSQKNIHHVDEKKIKVIKKITTNTKDKIKSTHSMLGLPTHTQQQQQQQQQLKKENPLGKQTLSRKNRKQVLKPNDNDGTGERFIIAEARPNCPPNINIMKTSKKRGRKPKSLLNAQQDQEERVVRVAGSVGVGVRVGGVRVGGTGVGVRVGGGVGVRVRGGGIGGGNTKTLNHRTHHRRRRRECHDSENYTPKTRRQQQHSGGSGRGKRRHWRKKKRGPGRPRKVDIEEYESTDLSDLDSLFDEAENEDLENEPILLVKQKRDTETTAAAETIAENIPTVELDLFTLPSLNEQQVSILLTEPQNPNFKVYASMDAIFVGDSALGDVTNQIGYVTDANNVVFVNPGHFLFPNVEDLENFVPSPILTMRGNNNNNNNNNNSKSNHTPVRQVWKLNTNKSSPKKDNILNTKTALGIGIKSPQRRASTKCDPSVARLNTHQQQQQQHESQTTTTPAAALTKTTTIPKLRENVSSVAKKESHPTKHLSGVVGVGGVGVGVGGVSENTTTTTTTTTTSTNSQHSVKRLRRKSKCITDIDKQQQQQQQLDQQQQQQQLLSDAASENKADIKVSKVGEDVSVKIPDESDEGISKWEGVDGEVSAASASASVKLDTDPDTKEVAEPSVAKSESLLFMEDMKGRTVNEILGIVSPRKARPRKCHDGKAPAVTPNSPPSPPSKKTPEKTLIVTRTIISEHTSSSNASPHKPKIEDDIISTSDWAIKENINDEKEEEKEGKLLKKEIITTNVNTNIITTTTDVCKKTLRSNVGLPRRQRRRRLRSKSAIIIADLKRDDKARKKIKTEHKRIKSEPPTLLSRHPRRPPRPHHPTPIDFEGFQRCSRQSGLRAKTLLRLVSLLNTKRWYHLSRLPFPIDQLCEWDDQLLDNILFA